MITNTNTNSSNTLFRSSVEFCGAITSEEGPFSTCDADFNSKYENCLYDMCLTNGDLSTLSQVGI